MSTTSSMRRAVVLGGGVAGLRAAQVMADGWTGVIVVEREQRPANPCDRGHRGPTGQLTNVTIMDGYDVVGFRPSADRRRVIGVRVTSRCGHGSQLLPADLVVDASGGPAEAWLAELDQPLIGDDDLAVDLSTLAGILSESRPTDRAARIAYDRGFIRLGDPQ